MTVKPLFKVPPNITLKESLHHRCPFIIGFFYNKGKMGHHSEKCSLIGGVLSPEYPSDTGFSVQALHGHKYIELNWIELNFIL